MFFFCNKEKHVAYRAAYRQILTGANLIFFLKDKKEKSFYL